MRHHSALNARSRQQVREKSDARSHSLRHRQKHHLRLSCFNIDRLQSPHADDLKAADDCDPVVDQIEIFHIDEYPIDHECEITYLNHIRVCAYPTEIRPVSY